MDLEQTVAVVEFSVVVRLIFVLVGSVVVLVLVNVVLHESVVRNQEEEAK